MRLPLAAKSVIAVGLLIACSLTLVGFYLERRERAAVLGQLVARLDAQAALVGLDVPGESSAGDEWARRAAGRTGARVTLIAADGRVLGDSQQPAGGLENHGTRPEVVEALRAGTGVAVRTSTTLDADLLYVARRLDRPPAAPVVLRLSVPRRDLTEGFRRFRKDFLVIALASLAAATTVALLLARRLAQPLRGMVGFARAVSRGDAPPRLRRRSRDEVGDLAEALNAMAADLHGTLQRLEDESRRVRAIMTNMAEGLVVLDGRGKITVLNPAAEVLLGISAASAMGQRPLEAVRSHELDDLLNAAAKQDTAATAEITLARPARRILGGSAVAMRDAAGAVIGTVLVLRDVTQLKRLEEIRMEFVLNVSHELRTPLTAIRGYVETLLEGALNERDDAQKFLEIIRRHAERLGRLLDDLLDLSNIELERVALTLRPLRVAEIVPQAIAAVALQAEQKGLRLSETVDTNVPPVLADRDRLVQVLINLLDNAVKYTPEGGDVHVRLSHGPVHPSLAEGTGWRDMVELSVEDTGIGIPAKELPRITERFYRVDKARSRELGGTGLGLAIVKHLVQAHQGLLTIESDLGRGTRVRVFLPPAPMLGKAPLPDGGS